MDRKQLLSFKMEIFIGLAAVAAAIGLAFQAFYPAEDGVGLAALGSLDDIKRQYAVARLDPSSPEPLVRQAAREVAKTDPLHKYEGITYRLTAGNRLDRDWLVQSPDAWGKSAADVVFYPLDCPTCGNDLVLPTCRTDAECGGGDCRPFQASVSRPGQKPQRFCAGHSDALVERVYDLVVSARSSVDISLLQPEADYRFLGALRNALTFLANSRRDIDVRILTGTFPPNGSDPAPFMQELTRDLGQAPDSGLRLFVGTTRSCNGDPHCGELTWNHAKVVAIDGKTALVGGHNMWTRDYLLGSPVHDLSMEVHGPAAVDAHRYMDALWQFVCTRPPDDAHNRSLGYSLRSHQVVRDCLPTIALPPAGPPAKGGVSVLSVGRLAAGITEDFADQSLIVRDLFLGAATKAIRMVQQDVPFSAAAGADALWPESAVEEMAGLIARGGDVYMVLTNPKSGEPMAGYSNGTTLDTVAAKFRDAVAAKAGIGQQQATDLVCRHFHLAPMRFGPDASWPEEKAIGVHTKLWIVDDRAFHIGSENIYPVALQEFGYVVEDRDAVRDVMAQYWDKAWRWSRAAAVSGDEAAACVLAGEQGMARSAGR
jgi:hypothetical protein